MGFKEIASISVNNEIPVKKYISTETGILVYVAQVQSPLTNAYLALATEEDTDDGTPHTLEHLIFLGSDEYPYKGVLDLLANRCLANGTNAWTETDNTVYTLSCGGTEGFLRLLPIYLDHVLFPTLTQSAFITEVYSITETGEDNGAVYCEMQGRENSGESRGNLELLRNIYPDHGYSKETGGIMKNIRESLCIEKIREYHKRFYRPENLAVIVAGMVDIDEVAKALEPIEQKVLKRKDSYPKFVKPWQTPVKPLKESKDIKILYPSDEEECGLVYIGFHGPKATSEYEKLTACYIIMKYLCETSVSPIQQSFIEIEDPFASSVGYNISENSTSMLYLTFDNVPVDKIDFIYERLIQLMVDIANGKDKIDEHRLKIVFEKYILERLSSLENAPHDDITFHVIGDFMYGQTVEDFKKRLNVTDIIYKLQENNIEYWIEILRKYFIDNKNVVIRAYPSIAEKEKLSSEESVRLENRRLELGEEGLAQRGNELQKAMAENDAPPPLEMLTSLPVPSTKSIAFHNFDIYKKTDKNPKLDLNQLPFYIEAYNLKTNFVYVTAAFDTSVIPVELRNYLLLFLDLIVESPVQIKDGELLPYEIVVAALEEDIINYDTGLGVQGSSRFGCGPFSNSLVFNMQVELKKLEIAIGWMTHLIFNSVFTSERVHILTLKLINDIATAKRNGYEMARDLLKALFYKKDSNSHFSSVLNQHQFLTQLLEELKTDDGQKLILDNLNKLRDLLIPSITIHIAANFNKVPDLRTALQPLIEKIEVELKISTIDHLPVMFDSQLINADGNLSDGTGTIVGMGCVESGYLFQSSPGISSFTDPDLAPLLLYLQYLSQLEGPMWKKIRKNSYGYNLVPKPNETCIIFSLYRATNIFEAYNDARSIMLAQLEEDAEFDSTLLESARSSLIFEIIDREKTIGDVVQQALLNSFKCVDDPINYNKSLVNQIATAPISDLRRVGKKHFTDMWTPGTSKIVIVCHPEKVESIASQFDTVGHKLIRSASLETSILNPCL